MFWGISEILLCTYYFHKTFTNTTLKLSKMKIIKQYTILQDGAFFKLKETAKQYKIKLYWIFNMQGPEVRVVKVETLSFLCLRFQKG